MRVRRHPEPSPTPSAIAVGSFDGVHRGHRALLDRLNATAGERGLQSAVLTFEPLPREHFDPAHAPARLSSLQEKLALLAGTGIDLAHVQRFDTRFASIEAPDFEQRLRHAYGARHVLVGRDFRYGARRMGDFESLVRAGREQGFTVDALDEVRDAGERISSTRVRDALAAGDFVEAARLLGRPYAICGRVVHGEKRGRELGYPTANVRLARAKTALHGIYAVKCTSAVTRGLEGVASLGTNPAVRDDGPATLEAFLFDFSGDLYGARLSIEFVKKLRDEAPFASLDALKAQIQRDCEMARHLFSAAPAS